VSKSTNYEIGGVEFFLKCIAQEKASEEALKNCVKSKISIFFF
jgi:hypothetical protein